MKQIVIAVFGLILVAGCYPKGPEYYSDLDLTVTDYDTTYNFGAQKNYWMADTARIITNIDNIEIDPADVTAIINQFETNFGKRGYDRLPNEDYEQADFAVVITIIATRSVTIGWIPGPPCWPGYWGCGGPWYPPYWGGYYASARTTGSVIMEVE